MTTTCLILTRVLALVTLVAFFAAAPARAQAVGIGVCAPSAPLGTAAERQAAVTNFSRQAQAVIGAPTVGRVFARAVDLTAALANGTVNIAIVDVATALRTDGVFIAATAPQPWRLVGRKMAAVRELKGATVTVPAPGGESDLLQALFGGELPSGYFTVRATGDVASALTAVALGKTELAVAPSNAPLPNGVVVITELISMPTLVLLAWPGIDGATLQRALPELAGPFGAFSPVEPGSKATWNRRFRRSVHRPVWSTVPVAAMGDGVVPPRALAIRPIEAEALVSKGPLPPH